jgi:hypothetical protein
MLSAYLVRMIENHAEDLTRELLDDLLSNSRTKAYHGLSRDELHRRTYDLYHNLGQWLADETDASIETTYSQMARQRHADGVPLSELIYALTLAKEHLRTFVRRVGVVYSALELHREVELNLMIGHFFDRAVYFAARGYEAAQARRHSDEARGRAAMHA